MNFQKEEKRFAQLVKQYHVRAYLNMNSIQELRTAWTWWVDCNPDNEHYLADRWLLLLLHRKLQNDHDQEQRESISTAAHLPVGTPYSCYVVEYPSETLRHEENLHVRKGLFKDPVFQKVNEDANFYLLGGSKLKDVAIQKAKENNLSFKTHQQLYLNFFGRPDTYSSDEERFRGVDKFECTNSTIYYFKINYEHPDLSDWVPYDMEYTQTYRDEHECDLRSMWFAVKNPKTPSKYRYSGFRTK